jgi:hypothetical protein
MDRCYFRLEKAEGMRCFRLRRGRNQGYVLRRAGRAGTQKSYLLAKDSAAFAAKALIFLGLASITFISCQS